MFEFLTRKNKPAKQVFIPHYFATDYTVNQAMKDSTVTGCVRILSDLIGQLPLSSDDAHVNNILLDPNYIQTQNTFLRLIVQNTLLYGECFIEIVRNNQSHPTQLNILDNDITSAGLNAMNVPVYNYTFKQGKARKIQHNNIIHIRDLLSTGIEAISRLALNLDKIKLLLDSNKLIKTSFESGINIRYHFQSEQGLRPEQRAAAADKLQERFRDKANEIIITGQGGMKELKGITPADFDLRELRKTLISEVASIFSVPASLVGGNSDQKYSNVRQKATAMYRDTILPLTVNIEQEFTRKLGANVSFDATNLVKGDLESQMRFAAQGYAAGILTANEARISVNLTALDGDVYNELKEPKAFETDDARGSVDEPNEMQPENNRGNDDEN